MYTFADWTDDIQHSMMRRLNRHFQGLDDFISLAGGLPDPELMPNVELAAAANKALLEQWSSDDPVDQTELERHDKIAESMERSNRFVRPRREG